MRHDCFVIEQRRWCKYREQGQSNIKYIEFLNRNYREKENNVDQGSSKGNYANETSISNIWRLISFELLLRTLKARGLKIKCKRNKKRRKYRTEKLQLAADDQFAVEFRLFDQRRKPRDLIEQILKRSRGDLRGHEFRTLFVNIILKNNAINQRLRRKSYQKVNRDLMHLNGVEFVVRNRWRGSDGWTRHRFAEDLIERRHPLLTDVQIGFSQAYESIVFKRQGEVTARLTGQLLDGPIRLITTDRRGSENVLRKLTIVQVEWTQIEQLQWDEEVREGKLSRGDLLW